VIFLAVLISGSLNVLFSTHTARESPLPRWPEGATIHVWIDPRNAPAGADRLVQRAMQAWTDAADRHFRLERALTADAEVRVHFVSGDGVYGEARPRLDRVSGAIISADVHINGEIAGGGDALDERIIIYLTALHELGHALGLPHTDDFSTIMYSFRRPDDGARYFDAYRRRLRAADDVGSPSASGVAPADIAALRRLYAR
jgi:predicted Zn-dependent protease